MDNMDGKYSGYMSEMDPVLMEMWHPIGTTNAHTHTYTLTQTHTHIYPHLHTHSHTHTHTHTVFISACDGPMNKWGKCGDDVFMGKEW